MISWRTGFPAVMTLLVILAIGAATAPHALGQSYRYSPYNGSATVIATPCESAIAEQHIIDSGHYDDPLRLANAQASVSRSRDLCFGLYVEPVLNAIADGYFEARGTWPPPRVTTSDQFCTAGLDSPEGAMAIFHAGALLSQFGRVEFQGRAINTRLTNSARQNGEHREAMFSVLRELYPPCPNGEVPAERYVYVPSRS